MSHQILKINKPMPIPPFDERGAVSDKAIDERLRSFVQGFAAFVSRT